MSMDLIALVRRRPDVHAVADGLVAMGEALELRGGEPEPTRLYDAEGRLLVSIEDPVQVVLQSEIARLLGPEFASRVSAPVWWVDVRAVGDLPDAVRIARKFTEALVHWVGGTSYPDGQPEAPALSWRASDPSEPGEGGQAAEDPAFPGGVIGG
ncbi:hypothetical protein [Actinomadura rugatobispora]|uniref:Uncharacterized protein n=1 Tax=Actinomadura rugatobispora TaxID=1994 RepID=A0ABW0ZU35_9ACTN|nr:hypothetical protein GCM10010200_050590 [Actinomadura rugatobispora]